MGLRNEAFFYYKEQGRRIEKRDAAALAKAVGLAGPTRNSKMVMFSAVKLKDLFEKGRDYAWQKPDNCPCCNSHRLWGHGFAAAIFDGYKRPLVLKLYRCPDCGCVIRLRPEGYFKRFQASIETIRSSITSKSIMNRWLPGISRSRQCHWFRALNKRVEAYLTGSWIGGVVAGFDRLLQLGQIPVSRFI
jgi:hypothetical protein